MQKLSAVDPSLLTNKQKLAFWINVYNFCVMHVLYKLPRPPALSSESEVQEQPLNVLRRFFNMGCLRRQTSFLRF
jgi:hypothetical protein